MAEREVEKWITVKGRHIPVFKGESADDAYNRSVAKSNEEIRAKQIAERKTETDKLNGKKSTDTTDDIPKLVSQGSSLDDAKDKALSQIIKDYQNQGYKVVPRKFTTKKSGRIYDHSENSVESKVNNGRLSKTSQAYQHYKSVKDSGEYSDVKLLQATTIKPLHTFYRGSWKHNGYSCDFVIIAK